MATDTRMEPRVDGRARSAWLAALLALGVVGCADQEESLIVLHSPAFEVGGGCVADANSTVSLQYGVLDVLHGTGYTLPVALRNNLASRPASGSSSGVDNSELQLRDVDVTLSMQAAPEVLQQVAAEDPSFVSFTVTLPSVSLPPGQDTGVLVEVISEGASRSLRQAMEELLPAGARPSIDAALDFHATRTGNSRGSVGVIDARSYTFPVELCSACLPTTCETCPEEQCPPDAAFASVCGNAQDGLLSPIQCEPLG